MQRATRAIRPVRHVACCAVRFQQIGRSAKRSPACCDYTECRAFAPQRVRTTTRNRHRGPACQSDKTITLTLKSPLQEDAPAGSLLAGFTAMLYIALSTESDAGTRCTMPALMTSLRYCIVVLLKAALQDVLPVAVKVLRRALEQVRRPDAQEVAAALPLNRSRAAGADPTPSGDLHAWKS